MTNGNQKTNRRKEDEAAKKEKDRCGVKRGSKMILWRCDGAVLTIVVVLIKSTAVVLVLEFSRLQASCRRRTTARNYPCHDIEAVLLVWFPNEEATCQR